MPQDENAEAQSLDDSSIRSHAKAPSLFFCLLLFLGALLLHVILLQWAHRNVAEIAFTIYDNADYLEIADRLQGFDFHGYEAKRFWGFPLAIELVSKLLQIPAVSALILVSLVSGILAVQLSYKLYGGYVASLFAVGNYIWLTFCLEGTSEPLFAALVYGGFLNLRGENWMLGGAMLALATIVRPVAVLALFCAGIALMFRHKYRQLAAVAAPAAAIGLAYLALLNRAIGDAFAQFRNYAPDWGGGWWPFSWPMVSTVRAISVLPMRWTGQTYDIFWIVLTFLGLCAMCLGRSYRALWRQHPIEAAFGLAYVVFFISYNRLPSAGAGGIDSRLIGPILPMILMSFGRWAEWDRIALVGMGFLAAILSACAMVGFRAVFGISLP
jgi:Gpi18-like mannosyltransferase